MMNNLKAIPAAMILICAVACAPSAPDISDIRPLLKEFLVALSRHDSASAQARATESFITGIGGEDGLVALMDRYAPFLTPNLFEFESPQRDGDAYRIHAYLHDGRRNMLPVDIWVVAGDGGWKVDRIVWQQPMQER
jgi:hypothetical protein